MAGHCGPFSIGNCIGRLAGKAAGDAFDQIAKDFGASAEHATGWLWGQINTATEVHVGGPGWAKYLAITGALAAVIGVGLFVIQVIVSSLRRDPGGMGRALRGLLVAFVAGGAAIAVTQILLSATDALSNGIMQVGLGTTNWHSAGALLLGTTALGALAPATLLVVALAMLFAVGMVWVALVVRKLLLIISAVFAPVAFAGSLADVTVGWTRKWIEYTVALAFSKVILVIIFVVGLGVLDNNVGGAGAGVTQQVTQVATGLLILAVAGFAPWAAIRIVHFAGNSFADVHAHGLAVVTGAQKAVAAPQKLRDRLTPSVSNRGGPQRQQGPARSPDEEGPSSAGPVGAGGGRGPASGGSGSGAGAGAAAGANGASEAGAAEGAATGTGTGVGVAAAAAVETARAAKDAAKQAARQAQGAGAAAADAAGAGASGAGDQGPSVHGSPQPALSGPTVARRSDERPVRGPEQGGSRQ